MTVTSFGDATATELAGSVNRYSISYPPSGEGLSGIFSIRGDPASISIADPMLTSRTSSLVRVNGIYREAGEAQPCGTPGCTGTVSTTISYNSNGNVSSRTDFNNEEGLLRLRPDARNLETARVEGSACAARIAPASLASPPARPDVRKTATTWHATYRLPAAITEPAPGGTKTTTFTYDTSRQPDPEDDRRAKERRHAAHDHAHLELGYGTLGRVATATDPNGKVTTYVLLRRHRCRSGQARQRANRSPIRCRSRHADHRATTPTRGR